MRASKGHRAVCQRLLDQAYQTELWHTIKSHFTSISLTDDACRVLDTYIIQPVIEAMKQCPPEQNDIEIDSTLQCLGRILHLPHYFLEISGDRLTYRYSADYWVGTLSNNNSVEDDGYLLPFIRSRFPSFRQNQCIVIALVLTYVMTRLSSLHGQCDQFDVLSALINQRSFVHPLIPVVPRLAREKNRDQWVAVYGRSTPNTIQMKPCQMWSWNVSSN